MNEGPSGPSDGRTVLNGYDAMVCLCARLIAVHEKRAHRRHVGVWQVVLGREQPVKQQVVPLGHGDPRLFEVGVSSVTVPLLDPETFRRYAPL